MSEVLRGDAAIAKTLKLKKISVDASGWVTSFKDDETNETWVLDYPESEHHGGGSPRLSRAGTD